MTLGGIVGYFAIYGAALGTAVVLLFGLRAVKLI